MKPEKNELGDQKSSYRPDIDGLRALAVVPVLLFHAKMGFPGGFVGVDVFFVISGFLISSLILRELAEGTFSLALFWERRIRRILPASLVMVLVTVVAGWFLFLPDDFERLGKSVLAQAAMAANVYFQRQMGYFAPSSETYPLLHTWSLAVEEQFYIVFPLILMAVWRWCRSRLVLVVWVLAGISFALSVIGTSTHPDATFYLLPTRAWELLLGTLLALVGQRGSSNRLLAELAGWIGMGLVALPMAFYDDSTRFPGLAALPPCLGAVLIVFSSGTSLTTAGRLLAWKPVRFVGLISYSLYLWHWPVLVFANYLAVRPEGMPMAGRIGCLVGSFALAIISWSFVEAPFRQRRIFAARSSVFGFAGVSIVVSLMLGMFLYRSGGYPSRLSPTTLRLAEGRKDSELLRQLNLDEAIHGKFGILGDPNIDSPPVLMIWGDSHAMAAAPAIDQLCRRLGQRGLQATRQASPPLLEFEGETRGWGQSDNLLVNQAVLRYLTNSTVEHVVLVGVWHWYVSYGSFEGQMTHLIQILRRAGIGVYILKEVPRPKIDIPRVAALIHQMHGDVDQLGSTPSQHDEMIKRADEVFKRIEKLGAVLLDPAPLFLGSNGRYKVAIGDRCLYRDDNHLSVEGARLLQPLFEPIFVERALK